MNKMTKGVLCTFLTATLLVNAAAAITVQTTAMLQKKEIQAAVQPKALP